MILFFIKSASKFGRYCWGILTLQINVLDDIQRKDSLAMGTTKPLR